MNFSSRHIFWCSVFATLGLSIAVHAADDGTSPLPKPVRTDNEHYNTVRQSGRSNLWVEFALVHGGRYASPPLTPVLFTCIPIGAVVPTKDLRGTIARIESGARPYRETGLGRPGDESEHDIIVVKEDAIETRIWLGPEPKIFAVTKASMDDVKTGTRVSLIGIPGSDGLEAAKSVLILPESLGGAGVNRWNTRLGSKMTTGRVTEITANDHVLELTLSYNRRKKKMIVETETPVVALAAADSSILQPATAVFIRSTKNVMDCEWEVYMVFAGIDRLVPPM